jgi:hypothetical protein
MGLYPTSVYSYGIGEILWPFLLLPISLFLFSFVLDFCTWILYLLFKAREGLQGQP